MNHFFESLKDKYKNISDKISDNIEWRDKEKMLKIFKRYHFLIFFGITFSVYMVILGIQGVFGGSKKTSEDATTAANMQTTVQNTTQAGNPVTTVPGTEGQLPTVAPTVPVNNTYVQADQSYLDGALFIGDSRTVLLQTYAGWNNTTFYCETGATIWKVMDAAIASVNGQTMTVDDALQNAKFNKIYLMLGINELGTGTADSFAQQYAAVINRIRQLQPQAVIYIQCIMHVTQARDDKGTYVNNAAIDERNAKIRLLADNVNVFWLDINEVTDEAGTGKMNPEYTSDGVHLKSKYLALWQDYLLSHAIMR